MIRRYQVMMIMFFGVLLLFSAGICSADDCDDYKFIDYYALGSYTWTHNMPAGCNASSAEIELVIRVVGFNDYGVLDLYCSNTSEFDYGSVTTAPSKPGFIHRITSSDCPYPWKRFSITDSLKRYPSTSLCWSKPILLEEALIDGSFAPAKKRQYG